MASKVEIGGNDNNSDMKTPKTEWKVLLEETVVTAKVSVLKPLSYKQDVITVCVFVQKLIVIQHTIV